jgi:hypothetical protein
LNVPQLEDSLGFAWLASVGFWDMEHAHRICEGSENGIHIMIFVEWSLLKISKHLEIFGNFDYISVGRDENAMLSVGAML